VSTAPRSAEPVALERVTPVARRGALGAEARAARRQTRERQENVIRWMRRFGTTPRGKRL
jgi:hypothetical protein